MLLSANILNKNKILSWFPVLDFAKNIKQAGDGKFINVSFGQKLSE
jgi:hypothetical protein